MAKKGDWVLTHNIILTPQQRAPQVPEDTHGVPLEMWVKGHLTQDAEIGDEVEIITRTGRHVRGEFVPELLEIGDTVRGILFGGDDK